MQVGPRKGDAEGSDRAGNVRVEAEIAVMWPASLGMRAASRIVFFFK